MEAVPNKPGIVAGKSSENYNGRTTSRYDWSQTIKDLEVRVPVCKDVLKGKDVQVIIKPEFLEVRISGQTEPILADQLTFSVNKQECCWNLIPGEAVTVFLQKNKERWWTGLLKSEDPIDLSSIEATILIEDLVEEEQMKVQELVWKEDQKKKGHSTSNNANLEAILKQAWDAEGSPFKGLPYDPNLVNCEQDTIPPELLEAARNSESSSNH